MGGTRVWKKITRNGNVETRVYVHAGPNLIAEYNAGAGASTPVQEYVYADQIDSLVMIHRSNNQKLGVTRNRQWSVVGLHDLANGNVVERYAYDMSGKRTIYAANGTTVRTTSSYGNNFGYTNRWHDEKSGLMYFRARYYNPLTGEFLRRDPLGFEDGMSLYRGYMELGWVDPTGTVKITCGCRWNYNYREAEIDCKGLFQDCCRKACREAGYDKWDGQPSRLAFNSELRKRNKAQDIPSQHYEPGFDAYFSRYVFSWETPHPADPYDLALTRGKIVIGGTGAAFLAARFGGLYAMPVLVNGLRLSAHYGRSSLAMAGGAYRKSALLAMQYYWAAYLLATRHPGAIQNIVEESAYMASGVPSPFPTPSLRTAADEIQRIGPLAGKTAVEITEKLTDAGFTSIIGGNGGRIWTKALPDGNTAAIRVDPAVIRATPLGQADEVAHVHKEIVPTIRINGGNYQGKCIKLNDSGIPSKNPKDTHIPGGH